MNLMGNMLNKKNHLKKISALFFNLLLLTSFANVDAGGHKKKFAQQGKNSDKFLHRLRKQHEANQISAEEALVKKLPTTFDMRPLIASIGPVYPQQESRRSTEELGKKSSAALGQLRSLVAPLGPVGKYVVIAALFSALPTVLATCNTLECSKFSQQDIEGAWRFCSTGFSSILPAECLIKSSFEAIYAALCLERMELDAHLGKHGTDYYSNLAACLRDYDPNFTREKYFND